VAAREFGPYELVEQIAVGGMAEIHLAKTAGIAGFEKYVALKMIHPNFSQDQHFIEMLIDEAKISVQLQHANIAQTFDLGRVGDTYYITMEYVDGCDLYHLLRRASQHDIEVPLDVAAYIAKEVATGLDYAHRKRDHRGNPLGIVHRDVSPQNVLLSHSGEVKIVDFGIAQATMRARQTAVGVIKGKYYYMSPEQAWADKVDHRTDIFSCGILLYEMLQGQMLYLEEDMTRLLAMVRAADIESISARRPDVPPQLERIVHHALEKRPDDRYRAGTELASDLERFLHVYSPVFTGARLARFVAQVLQAGTEKAPETPVPVPVPEAFEPRGARVATQRIQPSELIQDRSEITDENSVIFRMADLQPSGPAPDPDDLPSPGGRSIYDETSPALPRGVHSSSPADFDRSEFGGGFDEFGTDRTVVDDSPAGAWAAASLAGSAGPARGGDDPDSESDFDLPTVRRASIPRPPPPGSPDAADEADTGDGARSARGPARGGDQAASAAIAAHNPRPAVSAVRAPRPSRKTPVAGIPSSASSVSIGELIRGAVASSNEPGGRGVIAPPEAAAPVAPPEAPAPSPAPAFSRLSGNGFPVDAPVTNLERLQSLEIDELPDAFKLNKPRTPAWLPHAIIGGVVALLVLGVGALFLGGDDAAAPTVARIEVVSIPAGATVEVDGVGAAGTTPMTIDVQPSSEYLVAVRAPRYEPWQRKQIVPAQGGVVRVVAALKPISVTLIVRSTPEQAEVFVNGRSMGRTPLTLQNLDPLAATNIELRARGYRPERRKLVWGDATSKTLAFELKK